MRPQTDGPDDPSTAYEAHRMTCWVCETRDRRMRDDAEANQGRPFSGAYYAVTERRNGSG